MDNLKDNKFQEQKQKPLDNFRNMEFQRQKFNDGIARFSPQDGERILVALELARKAHGEQKRDEGDPYIVHPIRVANTLIYALKIKDPEMIMAALLHDVAEDTKIKLTEIKEKFGERTAQMVSLLTRKKNQETKEDKLIKTLEGSDKVKLIKACDSLDNLRSLKLLVDRGERWQRQFKDAKNIYIPLIESTKNDWLIQEAQKAYEEIIN